MIDDFQQRYEQAVQDASEEDLTLIAGLDRKRVEEWVSAPSRLRPFLLKRWREEPTTKEKLSAASEQFAKLSEVAATAIQQKSRTLATSLDQVARSLNEKADEVRPKGFIARLIGK